MSVGSPVRYRINGQLVSQGEPLTAQETLAFARETMTPEQWREFEKRGDLDFGFSYAATARFRINVYRQQGFISLAARVIPAVVPTLQSLALPTTLVDFTNFSNGLVIVAGPTGSGKSTTLAALLRYINEHQRFHIITLENPIEYEHHHQLSIVDQREVGVDTPSFARGLRACLRQDPDVILVGELRDLDTMQTAMTAAETGHLVFSTLHTRDAIETIHRIIDVYPAHQQNQVRLQLASVLQGVVAQRLVPRKDMTGRIALVEVLINTPAVANLIRAGKVHQVRSVLQTGKSAGMQTMEMHADQLAAAGLIGLPGV